MKDTGEFVWFITGTNRGIGLEATKQLLESSSDIIVAACRDPSKATALQALSASAEGRLHIIRLDVNDSQSIRDAAKAAAEIVGDRGIDYLINNAGINPGHEDTAFTFEMDHVQQVFQTNVAGPAYVAQSFISLVEKSKKKTIVNISSTLGSIGSDYSTLHASYAMSKAALNMLTYKQAKERPDITVISICPGWLRTDMGRSNAMYHVSEGVSGVLKVVSALTPEDSGKYFNFKGEDVPW